MSALNEYSHEVEAIQELVKRIKAQGLRVFVASRGTYGFFTNDSGDAVVSFSFDLLNYRFHGTYKTSNPRQTGTGWLLESSDTGNYQGMLEQSPPAWAIGHASWKRVTLEMYLEAYQSSSKFEEIK